MLKKLLQPLINWLFPDEGKYISRMYDMFMRQTRPFAALPAVEIRDHIQWPYSIVYFFYMISKEKKRYKVVYFIESGVKRTYIRRLF